MPHIQVVAHDKLPSEEHGYMYHLLNKIEGSPLEIHDNNGARSVGNHFNLIVMDRSGDPPLVGGVHSSSLQEAFVTHAIRYGFVWPGINYPDTRKVFVYIRHELFAPELVIGIIRRTMGWPT